MVLPRSLMGLTLMIASLTGCPAQRAPAWPSAPTGAEEGGFAPSDPPPPYAPSSLEAAIHQARLEADRRERAVEAETAEVAHADPAEVAGGRDVAVLRRRIAMLERCLATGQGCPPTLAPEDYQFDPDATPMAPPRLTAPLRFDVGGWRAITLELHACACACERLACLDAVTAAIEVLEPRPAPEVRGDEEASGALSRARACVMVLAGRRQLPPAARSTAE